MKKTVSKVVLSISIACLCACNAFAAGWESFVPDITVFAIFDASNKEIENATKQDISLHGYMDEVLRMQNEYRATTNDLIDNARFAYGDRENGDFSLETDRYDADPMSSLKQFKNFYETISTTINYYTKLIGYLCSGDFTYPALKAQTLECLLIQGYATYVLLNEYWELKKEELKNGRIIQRSILWYVDVANNLNTRLRRINQKLYAQVRIVREQKLMDKQDMGDWIRKRAQKSVEDTIKDITG